MEINMERITELRNEVLWLYSRAMADETCMAALVLAVVRGKTINDAKESLEVLLNDREALQKTALTGEDLIGVTDMDLDQIFTDFIPDFLRGRIEFLDSIQTRYQESADEISEVIAASRRKIGFTKLD